MSLEQLVCALDPVRDIPPPALEPSQSFDLSQEKSHPLPQLSIPKELWRLVDALWQGGMREKDLFASSAEPGEVRAQPLWLAHQCVGCQNSRMSGHWNRLPSMQPPLHSGGSHLVYLSTSTATSSAGALSLTGLDPSRRPFSFSP
jgi:hypothetical protein